MGSSSFCGRKESSVLSIHDGCASTIDSFAQQGKRYRGSGACSVQERTQADDGEIRQPGRVSFAQLGLAARPSVCLGRARGRPSAFFRFEHKHSTCHKPEPRVQEVALVLVYLARSLASSHSYNKGCTNARVSGSRLVCRRRCLSTAKKRHARVLIFGRTRFLVCLGV